MPNESEQTIINRAVTMRNQGKSLLAISEAVSVELTKLSHVTVKRILVDAGAYS